MYGSFRCADEFVARCSETRLSDDRCLGQCAGGPDARDREVSEDTLWLFTTQAEGPKSHNPAVAYVTAEIAVGAAIVAWACLPPNMRSQVMLS